MKDSGFSGHVFFRFRRLAVREDGLHRSVLHLKRLRRQAIRINLRSVLKNDRRNFLSVPVCVIDRIDLLYRALFPALRGEYRCRRRKYRDPRKNRNRMFPEHHPLTSMVYDRFRLRPDHNHGDRAESIQMPGLIISGSETIFLFCRRTSPGGIRPYQQAFLLLAAFSIARKDRTFYD